MNAKEMAAKRLAGGARTEKELVDFLCRKGIDREEAAAVASEFKEDGYIDDFRYACDYIEYGEGKGWGKARILRELGKKGVSRDLVQRAFEEKDREDGGEAEEERALRVVEKMMRGKENFPLDEKTRGRLARRLFSYGYSTSVIYSTISRYEKERSDDYL